MKGADGSPVFNAPVPVYDSLKASALSAQTIAKGKR
jgi:hypothetical protein